LIAFPSALRSDVISIPVAVQVAHCQVKVESLGTLMVPKLWDPLPVNVLSLPPGVVGVGGVDVGAGIVCVTVVVGPVTVVVGPGTVRT